MRAALFYARPGMDLSGSAVNVIGAGVGATQTDMQSLIRESVSVFRFMTADEISDCKGLTNKDSDHTSAINKAITYFQSFYGGALYFPPGNYTIKSQIVINDLYFKTLIMDGAILCGASPSTTYDAVFKLLNAEGVKIVGSWGVTADASPFSTPNDPNKYDAGFSIQAVPGGQIKADTGIAAFIDIYGLQTFRVKCGVVVGTRANDAQMAEITFHGLMTPFCPAGIKIGGSQTVVSIVGGVITSNPSGLFTAPTYGAIIMEGGAVQMVGGELTSYGTQSVVDFTPAQSATYFNPYPAFSALNTLIENQGPFATIRNPNALSNPLSSISHITLSGCYGYCGDLPVNTPYILVSDASYKGKISIDENCHIYQSETASARLAPTVDASAAPNTVIVVGKRSFVAPFPQWMKGISGGTLVHGMELAIIGYVQSGTYTATQVPLKPTAFNTSARYARYTPIYDSSTGIITAPPGGIKTLRVEVNITATGAAGDLYLKDVTNATIVAFGQMSGGTGNLVATYNDIPAGAQIAVYINPTSSITFGGSITNNINVYIGND